MRRRMRSQSMLERHICIELTSLPVLVGEGIASKFNCDATELVCGHPRDAALGLASVMQCDEQTLRRKMLRGVDAIVEEVTTHGSDADRRQLHYVMNEAASAKKTGKGVRDEGRNGERFSDFCLHPHSIKAKLEPAHVLALRLYTRCAYINGVQARCTA